MASELNLENHNDRHFQGVTMEVEMKIRGLMMDPVTNMPIVILKDAGGDDRTADLGGGLRSERDCAGDREGQHAAADDA